MAPDLGEFQGAARLPPMENRHVTGVVGNSRIFP